MTFRSFRCYLSTALGAIIAAVGYAIFQVPHGIAAGGVSGIAVIVNHFKGWPVGVMIWIMNLPLLVLGFRLLGGWRFLGRTILGVSVFSATADFLLDWLPHHLEHFPVSQDVLLSAIYAGVVAGVGNGIVFTAGGSLGGTGVIGRILQRRWGVPLSSIYLYTDGGIIVAAGLALGWEAGLFSMLTLFLSGLSSDYVMEGPSAVRTATVITSKPEEVSQALQQELGRGTTFWEATGGYSHKTRSIVMSTIGRAQVNDLREILQTIDPMAFLTVGVSHQAYGKGFLPLDET